MATTTKLIKVDFIKSTFGDIYNYVNSELCIKHEFNFDMLKSDFIALVEKNGAKLKTNSPDELKKYIGLIVSRSNFSEKPLKNAHFIKSVEMLETSESVLFSDIAKSYKAKAHKNGNSDGKQDYFYLVDLINLVNAYNKALITNYLKGNALHLGDTFKMDLTKLNLLEVKFETIDKIKRIYRLVKMSETDKLFNVTLKVYEVEEVEEDELAHFDML